MVALVKVSGGSVAAPAGRRPLAQGFPNRWATFLAPVFFSGCLAYFASHPKYVLDGLCFIVRRTLKYVVQNRFNQ